MLTGGIFLVKKLACSVSLISILYVLPRELELDNSNHLEVSAILS